MLQIGTIPEELLEEVPQTGGGVVVNSEQVAKLVQFKLPGVPVQHSGLPLKPQNKHSFEFGHLIFNPLVQAGVPLVQIAIAPEEDDELDEVTPDELLDVVSSLQAPRDPVQLPGLLISLLAQQAISPVPIIPQSGKGLVPVQSGSLPGAHITTLPAHVQQAPEEEEEDPPLDDEEPKSLQVNTSPLQIPLPPVCVQQSKKLPFVPPQNG